MICQSRVRVRLGFGLCSGLRLGSGLGLVRSGSGFGLRLDLRSWLLTSLTHSWRSDAINFVLAYRQIADLSLLPFFLKSLHPVRF